MVAKEPTYEEFYENLLDNEDIYFNNDRVKFEGNLQGLTNIDPITSP